MSPVGIDVSIIKRLFLFGDLWHYIQLNLLKFAIFVYWHIPLYGPRLIFGDYTIIFQLLFHRIVIDPSACKPQRRCVLDRTGQPKTIRFMAFFLSISKCSRVTCYVSVHYMFWLILDGASFEICAPLKFLQFPIWVLCFSVLVGILICLFLL